MAKKKKYKVKKISLVFLVLFIVLITGSIYLYNYIKTADIRKLKGIGYDEEQIQLIKDNDLDANIFDKYGYVSDLSSILNNSDYKQENTTEYLDLINSVKDVDTVIYVVNNNIDYSSTEKLISFTKTKYYIVKNIDRYLKYDSDDVNYTVRMVNSNRDYDFYTNTTATNTSAGLAMLVNKYYYLDEDYYYGELVDIESKYSNNKDMKLNSEAYEAFKNLVADALDEGYHIKNNYAYRDYKYQEGVYNGYKKNNGESYADSISARPGYSEHQTGLALDVGVDNKYASDKFQYSKEYKWMKENSYKYGFILRYPEGKEDITGYKFEAWHYRYVGEEIAKVIYENDLTLEEYYAYYVNNK